MLHFRNSLVTLYATPVTPIRMLEDMSKSRTISRSLPRCFAVALLFAAACVDDGTVTIKGDVSGLDTMATRGDSLLAAADRLPSQIDSLRAVVEGRIPPSTGLPRTDSAGVAEGALPVTPTPIPASGGAALTRRARARGDSMARAAAARFVEGASGGGRSRADSVRGVIRVAGNAPAQYAVLETSPGSAPVTLSGMATSGMTRLGGTEVVVRGVLVSPRDIVVADYFVRASNGVPAYDGTLELTGDGANIVLADGTGRKRISFVPPTLRELNGARVWVAVPSGSSTPSAYGIVSRR